MNEGFKPFKQTIQAIKTNQTIKLHKRLMMVLQTKV